MPIFSVSPQLEYPYARLRELLRARSFQEREVTLSSGKKSNFYIDTKQTSLCAEGHFLIGQLICAWIRSYAPTAQAVGGLTLGADPIASATATVSYVGGSPLDAFIIRKEPKKHGTQEFLEGANSFKAQTPVVILEDVVTTGASTIRAIERAQAAGLQVLHALALVDRQEGGKSAIEDLCPLTSLYTRQDFLPSEPSLETDA